MPKKFKGENSKAVAAKERRSAQQAEIQANKEKAIEDAYWADDDKQVAKKQQRKVTYFSSHIQFNKTTSSFLWDG
jgi:hypothetical protein